MNRYWGFLALILLGLTGGVAPPILSEAEPLFSSNTPLQVRIVTDFATLFQDRGEEREYHAGAFYWDEKDKEKDSLSVKLMVRGNFRRQKENCRFPPIRLNFVQEETVGTLFEGQDKLKLVTHCQDRDIYEQYNLEEYLTYRMFNELTENSFRVRLLKISYEDIGGQEEPILRYGFLIEDDDRLAVRLGGKIQKAEGLNPKKIDPESEVLLSMFAFMIGNTDWSVPNLHNIKVLERGVMEPYIAIPYDFDWCGLIAAPYAVPNPLLNIHSVRERVYRGICQEDQYFEKVVRRFNEEKADIYQLFDTVPGLNPKVRKKALKYLDRFYKIINSESSLKALIILQCR